MYVYVWHSSIYGTWLAKSLLLTQQGRKQQGEIQMIGSLNHLGCKGLQSSSGSNSFLWVITDSFQVILCVLTFVITLNHSPGVQAAHDVKP